VDNSERIRLAELVIRNAAKGVSTSQVERDEEIVALKKLFEEDLLPYNSRLQARGVLVYRWGIWTPSGLKNPPWWGPYAVFVINGEEWRMSLADPLSIKVLIMPPDADIKKYWEVYIPYMEKRSLDEFIFNYALPTYSQQKKKRKWF
jgi:hypothetical protein